MAKDPHTVQGLRIYTNSTTAPRDEVVLKSCEEQMSKRAQGVYLALKKAQG